MTAAEALLRVEEQMLKAERIAIEKAAQQPDSIGRLAYSAVADAHKYDAAVCRVLRESL